VHSFQLTVLSTTSPTPLVCQVPLHSAYDLSLAEAHIREELSLTEEDSLFLLRRSLDARGRAVKALFQYSFTPPQNYSPAYTDVSSKPKVLVVGAGPAGLFAALRLIELGFCPIVVERGKNVRERRRDLAAINKAHIVNPESNYCFGEGGAGTYSDGKLYTRSKKRGDINRILHILVAHGAHPEILVDAHPHIGTNKLPVLVSALSERITASGGQIHFNSRVADFILSDGICTGVRLASGEELLAQALILATGHSARDIFQTLNRNGVLLEAKPFAIGVRVEHPQSFINGLQYRGAIGQQYLPAAAYALNAQTYFKNRQVGVFTFCMCPGGFIVPAATAPGELVVNGMSPSRRDSYFANSGVVVEVNEANYGNQTPLAALEYQQKVEAGFAKASNGTQVAPGQLLADVASGKPSHALNDTSYQPGLASHSFADLLPPEIFKPLQAGIAQFNKKMPGYIQPEAQMIGLESRTSSPVRIPRNAVDLSHPEIQNLYPCGEGAGYAGGILSAAMDGERCAEACARKLSGMV
jgi:uncharacterized protein